MLESYIQKIDLLSKAECLDIMEEHKNAAWGKHRWSQNAIDSTFEQDHDPSVLEMDPKWGHHVFKKLEAPLRKYFDERGQDFLVKSLSVPRFNKYVDGQTMDWHVDHIHSLFDGNLKGIPILSINTLLNDDYVGGEFCLNLDGKEVVYTLNAGQSLIWPSVFLYPHHVKPVTKGERQAFITWGF